MLGGWLLSSALCRSIDRGLHLQEKLSGSKLFFRQNANAPILHHSLEHSTTSQAYARMLVDCGKRKLLSEGRRLHARIVESGLLLEEELFLGNRIVGMYGKCGSVEDAQRAFDSMSERNVFTWTGLIAANAQNGHSKEALQLLLRMQLEGVRPDSVALITALAACSSLGSLPEGRMIHACARGTGLEADVMVGSSLVNMYGKCGSLEEAESEFEGMPRRDVVTWNTMLALYHQHGWSEASVGLFRRMEMEGFKPDNVTFITLLYASARCGELQLTRESFERMHHQDLIAWTFVMGIYVEHGDPREALQLFRQMQLQGVKPNEFTLVTIANSFVAPADLANGRGIHSLSIEAGVESELVVATALVSMYGKCGDLQAAKELFDRMPERDVVSWTAMIATCAQHGYSREALHLFRQMQLQGMRADAIAFVSVLNACSSLAFLAEGKLLHSQIVESKLEHDPDVGISLVALYGKCGNLPLARAAFEKMPRLLPISWTSIVAAYAQNGHSAEALDLFWQMQAEGIPPDSVAFISVLSACSHSGLVEDGCYYFGSMVGDHGLIPATEHYGCIIDLLGRAGWLAEAEVLIKSVEVELSVVAWRGFLAACMSHGDVERGKRAAEQVLKLDPRSDAGYIMLSNMYSGAPGKQQDAHSGHRPNKLQTQSSKWEYSID